MVKSEEMRELLKMKLTLQLVNKDLDWNGQERLKKLRSEVDLENEIKHTEQTPVAKQVESPF